MSDEDRRAQAAALDAWMKEEGLSEGPAKYDEGHMAQMVPLKEYRQILAKLTELKNTRPAEQIRIEALRAASRTMNIKIETLREGRSGFTTEHVINTAKRFERYLETGE